MSGNLSTLTNALGQVASFPSYNADGRVLTSLDLNGIATVKTYAPRGWLATNTTNGHLTTYGHDTAGNLTGITPPNGATLTFGFDVAHRNTSVTDMLGNHINTTLDNAGNTTLTQVYDATNTLVRQGGAVFDAFSRETQITGSAGQATTLVPDNNGNVLYVTDPVGRTTSNSFDGLNRKVQVEDANGNLTTLAYNADDLVTTFTDPVGNTTYQTYNGFGDNTQTANNVGVTTRTFDAAGALARLTDGIGNTSTYTRDALERPTQILYPPGTSTTYIYDLGTNGVGHLTTAGGPAGERYDLTYDADGHETLRELRFAGNYFALSHNYDSTGELSGMVYPSNMAVSYSRDAAKQISGISVNGASFLSGITHMPFGPVKGWTWGAGTGTAYTRTFDLDYNLTSYPLNSGTRTLTYYADQSLHTASDSSGTQTFTYDNLRRVRTYTAPGGVSNTYGYDANRNLTSLQAAAGTTTFSIHAPTDRLASYTPPGGPAVNFGYDADGATNSVTGIRDYFYDARERMVQMWVHSTGVSVYYIVDAFGQRIVHNSTLGGANSWNNVYDTNGDNLGDYSAAGTSPVNETIRLEGIPVGVAGNGAATGTSVTPSTLFRIYAGHLGEPRAVTDLNTNLRLTWPMVDPYGNNAVNANPSGLGNFTYNLRFPGQSYDPETGTLYNFNRDYSPVTARYLQPDPLGLKGGQNSLYSYVGGNPVNRIDPRGLLQNTPDPNASETWPDWANSTYRDVTVGPTGVSADLPTSPLSPKQQATINACVANYVGQNYGAAGKFIIGEFSLYSYSLSPGNISTNSAIGQVTDTAVGANAKYNLFRLAEGEVSPNVLGLVAKGAGYVGGALSAGSTYLNYQALKQCTASCQP